MATRTSVSNPIPVRTDPTINDTTCGASVDGDHQVDSWAISAEQMLDAA
jgi:hypothetical protein